VLSAKADRHLQLNRFLPPTPIKICIDASNRQVDKHFVKLEPVLPKMGMQLVKALQQKIEHALDVAKQISEVHAKDVRIQCQRNMQNLLGDELTRLITLQEVNPSIRQEEIEHLEQQIKSLREVIAVARVNLEAVRLVVNNP
jgi:ATP-dependent helicase HepA